MYYLRSLDVPGAWERAPHTSPKSSTTGQYPSYNYPASCSWLWLRTIRSPCMQQWPDLQYLLSVPKFEKSSWWCPLSKQWMTQVCGESLAGRTDINALWRHKLRWRHIRFKLIWVRENHTFYWCIEFEKFFSLIYQVAKNFLIAPRRVVWITYARFLNLGVTQG